MGRINFNVGEYTVNQVDYNRSNGSSDVVCQVKKYGAEICHCTWHPDGAIHCKDRNDNDYPYSSCPLYASSNCLR
ncbi:MAG: hypothetical protein NC033_02830 [Clostridiales bacterium]|nr:hypothetical protein [Clostridiales bacterium]